MQQQQVIESSTQITALPLKQIRRKAQERIQESGFESQNQQLIDLGFTRLARNLRLLRVHKGELEPVIAQLQERTAKRKVQESKESGFESQNQQLIDLGFTRLAQNLRLLRVHKGELEPVIAQLQEKTAKRQARRAAKTTQEGEVKVRKERKAHKGMKKFDEWPSNIQNLYLDGNTMFCASHYVRKLTNDETTKKLSEKNLTDLALCFAQKVSTVNVTLVFEKTSTTVTQDIVTEKGTFKFNVVDSAPEFTSLIEKAEESLFVTAKRELRVKLNENGAKNILTVRRFLCLARKVLGEETFAKILSEN